MSIELLSGFDDVSFGFTAGRLGQTKRLTIFPDQTQQSSSERRESTHPDPTHLFQISPVGTVLNGKIHGVPLLQEEPAARYGLDGSWTFI